MAADLCLLTVHAHPDDRVTEQRVVGGDDHVGHPQQHQPAGDGLALRGREQRLRDVPPPPAHLEVHLLLPRHVTLVPVEVRAAVGGDEVEVREVVAVALLLAFGPIGLVATHAGLIIAHAVLGVPFVIITVSATLQGFNYNLVRAANSLGASPLLAFRKVTLPLIAPGVISGALFAFVTSFDEVIVSLFITSPQLKTLPVQIFASMTRDADPTVAALGSLVFAATTLLIGVGLLIGTSKGRKS